MSNDDIEEWRPVPGYEDHYEVSSHGRVRRKLGHPRHPDFGAGYILGGYETNGYIRCVLSKDNVQEYFMVHQLVALAWIGPCPEGKETNHINGIRNFNRPSNLEYVTRSQNALHKFHVNGYRPAFGARHHAAKTSADDVAEARRLLATGMLQKDVAARFGHTQGWASKIARGTRRKDG